MSKPLKDPRLNESGKNQKNPHSSSPWDLALRFREGKTKGSLQLLFNQLTQNLPGEQMAK